MQGSAVVAKINSLLASKGISKQEFYKDCGISSASYSLWNTGKTKPRPKNLAIIADYLGVSVSDLTGDPSTDRDKKEKPSTLEGEELGYSDIELLTAYRLADTSTKEAIQRILRLR